MYDPPIRGAGLQLVCRLVGLCPLIDPNPDGLDLSTVELGGPAVRHLDRRVRPTRDEDEQIAVVNEALCMGCGVCEDMCPEEAIALIREPSKGDPLDLKDLLGEKS